MPLGKRPFAVAAAGNATLFTGGGGLYGITLREATAVAAAGTLTVFDNTAASGTAIAVVRVAADGEANFTWDKGIKFGVGLTVAAVGADFAGSLIVGGPGGLRALPFAGVDALLRTIATAGPASVDSVLAAETAGAAAEWRVFDATSITGNAVLGYSHVANETAHIKLPEAGATFANGIQYDQVSGATSGAVYIF
jgi:hypothetical protein